MATAPGWIRQFHKSRGGAPLVICPHAGGGASTYRPFSTRLRDDFDVVVLQYPGRQDRARETPLETLPEIAAGAFEEFARSPYNRGEPVTVFGHSMGSIVAFEFTRLAEAAGVPVRLLGVSGAVPPSRVAELPPHPTEDEQLLDHVSGLQGTGSDVLGNRELMRMALPALKADYAAFDRYSCPADVQVRAAIHAMGGSDDEYVTMGDLYGWQRHTSADLRVDMFDGGHFYLHDQVDGIAELLVAEREVAA
ncbi:alpha/beta fold hydrolase [Nocardia sp. CDC159]|uniref:Thioesterase TesA n=1 Tax=Nocardia pulmonis TaxID=2951408 RepID=A0A9X2IZH5_9NOCA|nr:MULTISPECIES: alpha/beta fold hydrolase [Nocardia]MCM6776035.1 alpha/beta fold hydrolase [Nocardia pulmonis]MCM6788638.1 alpha/beta fold hydrolase [Nocardia sp. CDC159]